MVDDEEIHKIIKKMCDEKYNFICYTMAVIIRNTHKSFPNVPFEQTACPQPLDISSNKYSSDKFTSVVKENFKNQDTNIKKSDIDHYKNLIQDSVGKAVATGAASAASAAALAAFGPVIATIGVVGVLSGTVTADKMQQLDAFKYYTSQYGLVIYQDKFLRPDQIYYLADMLTNHEDNRPKFDFTKSNNNITTMINKMIEIRKTEINNLGGTDEKSNCLKGINGVYPIYPVGTFKSQNSYNSDFYYQGMYVMFVAGVYNFFEILKYVLIKKYKNQYCEQNEHLYYEAMQRMQIQIGMMCEKAFGVKSQSEPIKNIIEEEMKCALDPDFTKSFKIDYCGKNGSSSGSLQGMPSWGWKAAVGVGVGAAALYGYKKWRDYKNARTKNSSSSSSKLKRSNRGSRRKVASAETTSKRVSRRSVHKSSSGNH